MKYTIQSDTKPKTLGHSGQEQRSSEHSNRYDRMLQNTAPILQRFQIYDLGNIKSIVTESTELAPEIQAGQIVQNSLSSSPSVSPSTEGSSDVDLVKYQLDSEIETLLLAANYEEFDDGIESELSKKLLKTIMWHGSDAILIIMSLISTNSNEISVGVISEVLQTLGQLDQPDTVGLRRLVLEKYLLHPSSWVRDGALVGISWINDPQSIPKLHEAIVKEQITELRNSIKKLSLSLETQQNATSIESG